MTDMLTRAASDSDKAAQEARSKKYHIAIKEGGNVTKPSEWESLSDDEFADPVNFSYPLMDKSHADNAASRWGDASNRQRYTAAEQKIIGDRIEAAQQKFGEKKEKRMNTPVVVRADGTHEPMSGTHSHSHASFGSQGGDETHEHSHSHDGDATHNHHHGERGSEPDILRTMPSELELYAPIVRIDKAKREVIVRATSEALDSYKTVFDFEGSKQAFAAWRGNIREMHDPHKAVGAAIKWEPREQEKAIDITLHVSRGAEDTWQKLIEDPPTLTGASVGAKNGVWEKRVINGEEVPVLVRYDLVEVSLVDNPANPDCRIQIVRADGMVTEVLDDEQEALTQPEDMRAGKSFSAANASKLHQSAIHALQAAKASADMCASAGCDACREVSLALDPDQDGDIDIGEPDLDTDGDDGSVNAQHLSDGTVVSLMHALSPELLRVTREAVETELRAVLAQLRSVSSRLAQVEQADTADITRRLDGVADLKTELERVRSLVSEVKATTESYASRASTGGPVVNTGFARGAMPQSPPTQTPAAIAAQLSPLVELLIKRGVITDREKQIQANLLIEQLANGGK